jgi:hypothetical protein
MASVVNPTSGTRIEPMDSYKFTRGTSATFKTTFLSEDIPIKIDTGYSPTASILEPMFLNKSGSASPIVLAQLVGTLVPGQEFEYMFTWEIPANQQPLDEYIISYSGRLGGFNYNFGDEYFTIISSAAGQIALKMPSYATISDVRMAKFNIDEFLPQAVRKDLTARNNIIEYHLRNAAVKLREELGLHKQRSNSENYKLFCIYYTIYHILLSSRGEDGSSVSDQNLTFWKQEWMSILAQEKRQSVAQGISLGRG